MRVNASPYDTLSDAQSAILSAIRERIDQAVEIPRSRVAEYAAKREELIRYESTGGIGSYPFMEGEAFETGKTIVEVMARLNEVSVAWHNKASRCAAIWQTAQNLVDQATSISEVMEIKQGILSRISAET